MPRFFVATHCRIGPAGNVTHLKGAYYDGSPAPVTGQIVATLEDLVTEADERIVEFMPVTPTGARVIGGRIKVVRHQNGDVELCEERGTAGHRIADLPRF